MSADRKRTAGQDRSGRTSGTGPTGAAASLVPEDAGKHPIKIIRAGEPGSHPDTRSAAAAARST
jgi:hypothetical protein